MRILVTGYSGFVGRSVLPQLLAAGHQLVCYGRSDAPLVGNCLHIRGDLVVQENFDLVPWSDLEGVLHLACAGVKARSRNRDECLRVNVGGLLCLLAALRERAQHLRRIVLTPTFYERAINTHPALLSNPYVATKHIATQAFRTWAAGFEGQASLATLFQVYGPGDDSGNVLNCVTDRLRAGEPAQLGGGSGLRDWIYIDDVADALAWLFEGPVRSGLQTHDLGSGQLLSIRHMAEGIAGALGVPVERLIFDSRRDRPDTEVALAASFPLPDWKPRIDPITGIRKLTSA